VCTPREYIRATADEPAARPAYDPGVDDSTRQAARTALLAERSRLQATLAEGIIAPGPMTYGSQAAAATQVFEQQRDLALRGRNDQHLADVDAALARIADRTYGLCVRCGSAVPKERLEALPWAAFCIDCQRQAGRRR
jgi:RNA polymerase-binding transcription factor DksA